jgi:SAM-dependent methyltransferase
MHARPTYKHLNRCLCCNGSRLRPVLELGLQPPANAYTDQVQIDPDKYPLGLQVCNDCWHSQLTVCVDRSSIFQNYSYASGTSQTLQKFFSWFANAICSALPPHAKVLELAANDGSLVQAMNDQGLNAIGVDPAQNIVAKARELGIPLIEGFWPEAATNLPDQYNAFVCMNVVAHVDDPQAFLAACAQKLAPGGFILVQPSQARMFGNMEFDTCYHEHLSFFNIRSMKALVGRCGLILFDSFLVKIHGDSPVYILGREDAPPDVGRIKKAFSTGLFAIDEELSEYEASIQLYETATYERFANQAYSVIDNLSHVVDHHRSQGFEIAFVGAAAKAMTVVNAAKVTPDYFFDEAELKVGRFPPGLSIAISPLVDCINIKRKTLFVLTAWNFKDELKTKIRLLGMPDGSVFYVYFPQPIFEY